MKPYENGRCLYLGIKGGKKKTKNMSSGGGGLGWDRA